MEYVSGKLSRDEISTYLSVLPSLLSELGLSECKISYGWQCELPIDDLWQAQLVRLDAVSEFVASATKQGIFTPGASDLFIESPDGSLSVRICHESDVHLEAADSALAVLASPIAAVHPNFSFKLDGSWQVRQLSGRS